MDNNQILTKLRQPNTQLRLPILATLIMMFSWVHERYMLDAITNIKASIKPERKWIWYRNTGFPHQIKSHPNDHYLLSHFYIKVFLPSFVTITEVTAIIQTGIINKTGNSTEIYQLHKKLMGGILSTLFL